MKSPYLIAALVLVCVFGSLPADSIQKDESLLDQSFNLSQNLRDREQLSYLFQLCSMSGRLNFPAEKTKEYSQTLYRLASTEQDSDWRTIGQKNAVTCLSYVDPVVAVDLLSKITFQRPDSGQWVPEDSRFNAAEAAFNNFLSSSGSITPQRVSTIIAKARYLGQTGQYPYAAAAEIINRLPASFKNEINILLNDAMTSYATETGFYDRDEEFLSLLQSLKNPAIDKPLIAEALTTFVRRLTAGDPNHFPGDYYEEVHISNGKVFPFTDLNEAFLFRVYPLLRRFNPALASQLSEQDPKLDEATSNMHSISGGFVQGDPTSLQASEEHLRLLQRSLIRRIKEQKDFDPQGAVDLAQRLTDTSSRIVGFSTAIPSVFRGNPSQARSLYEKQISDLANLDDSIGKLQAMVALAPAAYQVGDSNQNQSLSEQAFDMGLRFFNSSKATGVQHRSGFAELKDLVTSSSSQNTDVLQPKVENLPDGWLKAYLLLYEAEGHAKRNVLSVAPKRDSREARAAF